MALLTIEQAATFLAQRTGMDDLDAAWIRRQLDQGRIPCVVVKRKRRVRDDVLEGVVREWLRKAAA